MPVAYVGLSSLFITAAGVDVNELESSTGIVMSEFQSQYPLVIDYLEHLLQLLGVVAAGFAGLAALILLIPFRRRRRWSWYAAWLIPATFLGFVTVFVFHGLLGLGGFYGALALLGGAGLLFCRRDFVAERTG